MSSTAASVSRSYGNDVITTCLSGLLRSGRPMNVPLQIMQPIPQPRRPSNRHNLANIVRDLDEGFSGMEAIVVWKSGDTYYVIYGNQRYQAVQQKGNVRYIPCWILDGHPDPQTADLCYANLVASVLGPQPLHRSFVSKIIEIRAILFWYLVSSTILVLGAVKPRDVGEEMLKLFGGESGIIYQRHWCSKIELTTLRRMVFIAKVCMKYKMEDVFNSLERYCKDTDAQVSVRSLYKVMTLESHHRGRGRAILSRFSETIQGSSTSRKDRLTLLAEEETEFSRLTSYEGSGNSARRKWKAGGGSSTTAKGIAICESGVKKLEEGLECLRRGNVDAEQLRVLENNIFDIGSFISRLSS